MKKFSSILLAIAIMTMVTSNAYANSATSGIYLGAKMGLSSISAKDIHQTDDPNESENDTDTAFGGGIAVGYDFDSKFNIPVRTELEFLMFADATAIVFDDVEMDYGVKTLMANVYYDFNTSTKFTPYLVAGLGFAFVATDVALTTNLTVKGDGSDTNFAWNLGLGVGFDITENFTVDTGYKFMSLGATETGNITADGVAVGFNMKTKDLYANVFHVGVRYTF